MKIESQTFKQGDPLPLATAYNQFGHNGGNRSPHLRWSDLPEGTKSFAVVMHDPDAPTSGGFYHWVMFNIPSSLRELPEGAGSRASAPKGAVLGHVDYGIKEYGGPCPPPGTKHRYDITVYALDTESLPLDDSATGALLEFFLTQHALGKATLSGTYSR